ncbi:hypothetical protein [Halorarum salinum]|uniref:Secreted protein n=1 Tax=Halorarum salinum TaxID=2743089 RepID=A0A7D5LCV4_9EURY|nr:hypothetical protein [Halobaculum salinum]QLG63009.1 hypothetical protein HUG12_15215 [Halobaculum salinum]
MEEHSGGGHGDHESRTAHGYGPGGHAEPGGFSLAANGLRLDPPRTRFEPGVETGWTFRVLDDGGEVVTDFEESHGERSHLIVVRRDLTRFQHLHPDLDPDGTWRVAGLTLSEPGAYRAFVDVVVDGRPTTLGFDLLASGEWTVETRPGSTRRATAGEYEAELLAEEVAAREDVRLPFEVRRDGRPVPELSPYLGALGHLVALREGDLAYLHVHPRETAPGSGRVEFGARFPTPGRYRLFLQARPEGTLVTASFDVRVDG